MKNKKEKDKEENKIIQKLKSKWLINGTLTILLIFTIIAVFIAINIVMQNLNLEPIDLSQEGLYTLTEDSKEKARRINTEVYLYFIGYSENDSVVDLAKQYTSVNDWIKVQVVNADSRPDLVAKYGIDKGAEGIIVANGEKYKVLAATDLYTYDTSSYETIDITEEKLTSAIMSVTSEKIPKIYFLEGYSEEFSLSYNMNYLKIYLANEINEVGSFDILAENKVPDDCDTLVICTPTKDFDDIATNAIIDYINSGRNILWLNAALGEKNNFPNVNKILALYGVKPFEPGYILETDSAKMLAQTSYIISPNIESTKVTKKLTSGTGVRFVTATKINIGTGEELANVKVEKTDLLKASSTSFFRTDLSRTELNREIDEEPGEFIVGAELSKTIKEANSENENKAIISKMIIYGENNFITDYPINNSTPIIILANNKDLVLNSMAYLVDREEDIAVRKATGTVTYRATAEEDIIIRTIIFSVPAIIIFAGIMVWVFRRRKK